MHALKIKPFIERISSRKKEAKNTRAIEDVKNGKRRTFDYTLRKVRESMEVWTDLDIDSFAQDHAKSSHFATENM
ncbi:MAG: hypothetical protein AAF705_19140, partial [Bacteroidota bacterium]